MNEHAIGAGLMKAPEHGEFRDGASFQVIATVDTDDIALGDFQVQTAGNIDTAIWPSSGHFYINNRKYTYDSISGSNFNDCNGPFGKLAAVTIAPNDIGYQAASAEIGNLLLKCAIPGLVYRSRTQTGITISIAAFRAFDDTTELSYAGGTLALTDNAVNYVYAYNNAGTLTIAKDTTSWAAAKAAAAGPILELAKITTVSGDIPDANYIDERIALKFHQDAAAGAPDDAQYVLMAADGDLPNAVVLQAGNTIDIVVAGSTISFELVPSEIGSETWGNNAGPYTWDWDCGAGTNPSMTFADGALIGVHQGTPHSGLHLGSSLALPYRVVTAGFTFGATDFMVGVDLDAAASSVTATLPAALGLTGRLYAINNLDHNNSSGFSISVARTGADTINGNAGSYAGVTAGRTAIFMSDGVSNWILVSTV
jgi:hypothetical protein